MERESSHIIENFTMPDGVNIWPHLRSCFYSDISVSNSVYYSRNFDIPGVVPQQHFELYPQLYRQLTRVPRRSCLILTQDALHSERVGGKLYDPYLDPVAQEAARMGLLPVKVIMGGTGEGDFVIEPLRLAYANTGRKGMTQQTFPPPPAYADYIDACLRFRLPPVLWLRLLGRWQEVGAHAVLWEKILTFLEPSMLLLECYYTHTAMGAAQACRKLGIPCIEYQHGLQTAPHVPYNFAYMPQQGYDVVPEWFFHWGPASEKNMRAQLAGQSFHKTCVAGKPNYAAWKRGCYTVPEASLQHFAERVQGRIPICVALPVGEGVKLDILEAAMNAAPADWLWLLRRHPVNTLPYATGAELAQRMPQRTESALSAALPLHTVLQHSRHLVTGYSSSVLEAISLHRMEATCLEEGAFSYFAEPLRKGTVRFAASAEELLGSVALGLEHYPNTSEEGMEITCDIEQICAALQRVCRQSQGGRPCVK